MQGRTSAIWAMAASLVVARAEPDSGRGRHRHLYAVPAPGPVTVDGRLDDWDLSGQIETFVIEATRATQSAKFALMYNAEALYVSGEVRDPTPLMNRHDPKVEANRAWDADACQFRLCVDAAAGYPLLGESSAKYRGPNAPPDTRDDIVHMILWYYTDEGTANLQMDVGMSHRVPRPEWAPHGLVPREHYEGAYRKGEDGTGYTFEYRIPWTTLGARRALRAGDIVAGTVQFNWSAPDGLKTGGGASWAYDVITGPGFAYKEASIWGKIVFAEKGGLSREQVEAGVPRQRELPLEFVFEMPADRECTVQLFDRQGRSVRILVAQEPRPAGRNVERWDGLDQNGALLPPGEYVWKGICFDPLQAVFRFSAHNSGRPPYPTDDNRGGWGGDHGTPQAVCALPDGMLLSWSVCEYGWGIIRTDLDGRKLWGSKHAAVHMATDGQRLFIAGGHGFDAIEGVRILDVADARRIALPGGAAALAPPPGGDRAANTVSGLAWHQGRLYVTYERRDLMAVFDATNGRLLTTWPVTAPRRVAVGPDGTVWVVSDGKVRAGRVTPGDLQPPPAWHDRITDHLDDPQGLAVGAEGVLYVANQGALQCVAVFDDRGTLVRTIGKLGGRPARGTYDPAGMYQPGGIALDSRGRLWVAETVDGPKRVSVWDTVTGALAAEYFGGSSYFGYGFIDPAQPEEMYAHHVIWAVEWGTGQVRPKSTFWRPIAPNMAPAPEADGYAASRPFRVVTARNGRQYMWGKSRTGHRLMPVLLRREGDLYLPFAGLVTVDKGGDAGFGIRFVGENGQPLVPEARYFWQDGNGDQTLQREELTALPTKTFDRADFSWVDPDLTLWFSTGHCLRPTEITPAGQPRYDVSSIETTFLVGTPHAGGYFLRDEEGAIYTLAGRKDLTLARWDEAGRLQWQYDGILRWRDALNLPIVKAGRLWGMTGPMGVAGDYLAHQCYFGLNHIFRRDGMYVGSVLRDGRLGGRGPNEGQPEGQGGQFVRLQIGGRHRYFIVHGGQDSRVWEVTGLDTVQDLPGGRYVHTDEAVAKARAALSTHEAAQSRRPLLVARGRQALEVVDPVGRTLEDGRGFQVRLAYDAENLYARFDVTSPHELINAVPDPHILFRGGNCLDIQIAADPSAEASRQTAVPGDLRLLVTRRSEGHTVQPLGVLYRPKVAGFQGEPMVLTSPVGQESFDRIDVVDSVRLTYRKEAHGFTATVAIPHALTGLKLQPGQKLKLDLGYIFGNAEGTRTAVRVYLFNTSFTAGVVNDIPCESRLEPDRWGEALVE